MTISKNQTIYVILPREQLNTILLNQQKILDRLSVLHSTRERGAPIKHVTAIEFMESVKICRAKFDQLVRHNKIKTIKKKRKIYVPTSEVDRYFSDPDIE